MGRRKFFAFSMVKKTAHWEDTQQVLGKGFNWLFVLGLSDMAYSRNLHVFLFYEYNSPHEIYISLVCFVPFLVSPSTFITLFSGIEINITC